MSNTPKLRFSEFTCEWRLCRMDSLLERYSEPVLLNDDVEYREIGVRSHGNGIFHKDPTTKAKIGNKRVFWVHPKCLVLNVVFAWEQALALTSETEKGLIASHRFPMFLSKKNRVSLSWLHSFFMRPRGKYLLGLASPGGAGRNKTLGQANFDELRLAVPQLAEQQKIADFLTAVDTKIEQLTRKEELLKQYKKGVMQKIFSQEIRFNADDGSEFPEWEERHLADVLHEHKNKSTGSEDVFSVSVHKGLVNQIEHLGRSFAASDTSHYNLVKPDDIVYTKSPTGDFPYGIIKQSRVDSDVLVSPLYGVFTPESVGLGYMLHVYFESVINMHNYLHSIIQKGAKNTINITNSTFLSKTLRLPTSRDEQNKIGDFLRSIDTKIDQLARQLEVAKTFKKGLLQQMFV